VAFETKPNCHDTPVRLDLVANVQVNVFGSSQRSKKQHVGGVRNRFEHGFWVAVDHHRDSDAESSCKANEACSNT